MDLRRLDRRLRSAEHRQRAGAQPAHADHLPVPVRRRGEHGAVQRGRHHRRPLRGHGRRGPADGAVRHVRELRPEHRLAGRGAHRE